MDTKRGTWMQLSSTVRLYCGATQICRDVYKRAMSMSTYLLRAPPCSSPKLQTSRRTIAHTRAIHQITKHRQHRSDFWIPQANLVQQNEATVDVGQLLIRAGYLRQAYAGIFHMLPLGLRVQAKIEALVDKHMTSLSASKVSLSSISSQSLWDKTDRLQKGTEFFKFQDRRGSQWLLAPTHEEEITSLVKDVVHAPGHLPIRLYQISRKYRDEKRPRGGLLRGREFIMKDLYTFDRNEMDAHGTYAEVRRAYSNLFDELKVPYVEARADSGNMGGSLSHEFHFPSNIGEDDIITCSTCEYAKNEEFVPDLQVTAEKLWNEVNASVSADQVHAKRLISQSFLDKRRRTLVKAWATLPDGETKSEPALNPFAVKKALEGLVEVDTGIEDAEAGFASQKEKEGVSDQLRIVHLFDQFVDEGLARVQAEQDLRHPHYGQIKLSVVRIFNDNAPQSHLLKKLTGDACPECFSAGRGGTLNVARAIEVGHTFHLGSRYSAKLDLRVPGAPQKDGPVFVSMGCHGIGVSRLIAAVASALSDNRGLVWPRKIAPFEVLVVVNSKNKDLSETVDIGNQIYDNLSNHETYPSDVLIDDREDVDFGWKLKDADLIGYPVVVVIGKGWAKQRLVEVQCRRLKIKEELSLKDVPARIRKLLSEL